MPQGPIRPWRWLTTAWAAWMALLAVDAGEVPGPSFDGFQLAYVDYGTGDRVVVLVHGALATRRIHWRHTRRPSTQRFRAVTLGLPRQGKYDRSAESWRYGATT